MSIGVFYLRWKPYGERPYRAFLRSWAKNPPGIACQFSVVRPRSPVDLGTYFSIARDNHFDFYCFLNSYSRILSKDWLALLYRHVSWDDVGIVGCTASYESSSSSLRRAEILAAKPFLRRWGNKLRDRCQFPSFPNPHLRTNAFMISASMLRSLRIPRLRDMRDTSRLESGRSSITDQFVAGGYKILVVGRDGLAYGLESWKESQTFRIGAQENLLVADKRTDEYANADPETRAFLSRLAWGDS
jgi:hypothetical protein